MREGADGEVAHPCEPLGEHAQHDALAGAGLARDEREAALAHVAVLDAPAERLDWAGARLAGIGEGST
jgi:hypothetical protein